MADKAELDLTAELASRTKLIQQALFERLLNDNLLKQKLMEQIEAIESKRELVELVDPTPEQIEGRPVLRLKKFPLIFKHNLSSNPL